jgi:preprotein translocase subunit YajC
MMIQFLQATGTGGGMSGTLLFMVGFFAIFYFFMIRPQSKKIKAAKLFQESISVGAKVMTVGGIYGEVLEVDEKTVVLKLDQGRMRISKIALSPDSTVTEAAEKQ